MKNHLMKYLRALSIAGMLVFLTTSVGCEEKEKVLDIDTPDGGIEIDRSKDTGEIDVEIEDK